jgi:hypothetical protein
MSEHYPECPLYNHNNCKAIYSPHLCAIVRRDKTCLKKIKLPKKQKTEMVSISAIVSKKLHEKVKAYCAANKITIKSFIVDALRDKLSGIT